MSQSVDLNLIALGGDWWENRCLRMQLLNQKFATVLSEDDLSKHEAHDYRGFKCHPRMPASMKASGTSEVRIDDLGFFVTLDMDQFEPKDVDIITDESYVTIHAKHGEKKDQYGLVSREFTRQYQIPHNCDIENLTAHFSIVTYRLTIGVPVSRNKRTTSNRLALVPVVDLGIKQSRIEMEHKEFQATKQKILLENGVGKRDALPSMHRRIKLSPGERIGDVCSETIKKFLVTDDSKESLPEQDLGETYHANKVVKSWITKSSAEPVSGDSAEPVLTYVK